MLKEERPQTILFGNGINRLTPGCPSWEDLLAGIDSHSRRCDDFKEIPMTAQYEILLPDDYYTPGAYSSAYSNAYNAQRPTENIVKDKICKLLHNLKPNPFYKRLAQLRVENYITTNYEYLLHETFERQGCCITPYNGESRYNIRRCFAVEHGGDLICNIWNIHGEIARPNTMMLGLDQYCETIDSIFMYIKDAYENSSKQRFDTLEKRLKNRELDDEHSWIDTLFYTDVHIVGQGLDYTEYDIWWLLNRRMRLFRKLAGKVDFNTITYYGELTRSKAHLLQNLGVNYVPVAVVSNDYQAQYERIFNILEQKTRSR